MCVCVDFDLLQPSQARVKQKANSAHTAGLPSPPPWFNLSEGQEATPPATSAAAEPLLRSYTPWSAVHWRPHTSQLSKSNESLQRRAISSRFPLAIASFKTMKGVKPEKTYRSVVSRVVRRWLQLRSENFLDITSRHSPDYTCDAERTVNLTRRMPVTRRSYLHITFGSILNSRMFKTDERHE